MFRIALVQNLSEVRNYSYADLRGELSGMGFAVTDITRDNLHALPKAIEGGCDCVLFASNSLNDTKIYEYVTEESFISLFDSYLEGGGACLVLHQNALKEMPSPLPFIDRSIEKLEKNYASENVPLRKSERFSEQYYVFPNKVDISDISSCCFRNPAVSGAYWLLLRAPSENWTPILSDGYSNGVILSHTSKKVIFSSVLLDYQKHNALLENILVNLMVDNMSLAILESAEPDSLGFSYFLNSLENNKLYYKKYTPDASGMAELLSNIRLGIHSAILVDDSMKEHMDDNIKSAINKYGVKLIEINEQTSDRPDSFVVHSTDKSVSLLFSKIELEIQQQLSSGFISGSFMKTVEVLMRLREFEELGMTKADYTKESIAHVFESMSAHMSEDGSYDKTFGATCRALWLFCEFLGPSDPLTRSSYNYIKGCTHISSLRENLERHYVLSLFEPDRKQYLRDTCTSLIEGAVSGDFSSVTEYDFLTLLKVGVLMADEGLLMELYRYIRSHTDARGEFFNSYVTTSAVSYLIDMYAIADSESNKERIRELLFSMVTYLGQVNTSGMSIDEVLHTVCSLYKFESVVSFPVSDLTELIFKTGTFPHDYHIFERQINSYQRSRLEMDGVINESKSMKEQIGKLRIYKKGFFLMFALLVVAVYLLVYMMIIVSGSGEDVLGTLFSKILESWPSLFTLLIVPVVSFVFNRYLKGKDEGK